MELSKQVRAGGLTSFTISFTQLPPELTAGPTGSLGIISHYLGVDSCSDLDQTLAKRVPALVSRGPRRWREVER
jgi:hypothetical protein